MSAGSVTTLPTTTPQAQGQGAQAGGATWRGWREMVDVGKLTTSLPPVFTNPKFVAGRVRNNLVHFQLNYAAVVAAVLVLVCFFDLRALMFLAIAAVAYLLYSRYSHQGSAVQAIFLALAVVALVLLWVLLGNFWSLAVLFGSLIVVLLHAAFYLSDEEIIDFSRPI